MTNDKFLSASMIAIAFLSAGCNTFKISEGSSQLVDIQKRSILVGGAEKINTPGTSETMDVTNYKVCAEPSPDAMSAIAMQVAGKTLGPSKVSVELTTALQQSAAFVGLRTTSIQLLRDFGYRLCEAYLSGALNKGQYDLLMRRFQKNVVALLAIEQLTGAVKVPPVVLTARGRAETSQALIDQQNARDKVSEKIASLGKEKKAKESEKAELLKTNPTADTKTLDSQIAAKEDEIKRRQADLEAIDKGIANARGSLAGGQTEATIGSDSSPAPRSVQDLQTVADVVQNITIEIVKGKDKVQECLLVLQSTERMEEGTLKEQFAKWCMEEIKLDQEKEKQEHQISKDRFAISNIQIEEAKKVLSDSSSTDAKKDNARKMLTEAQKQLEELVKGKK